MHSLIARRAAGLLGLFLLFTFSAVFPILDSASADDNEISKGDASIAKRSAKLYIKQRLYEKAIEQLEIAIQGKPDDMEAHYLLGNLYSERGMMEEMNRQFGVVMANKKGKKKYGKEIGQTQDMWWTRHYNGGVKSMNAQDHDAALESFRLAKSILPNRADTYKGLGLTYLQMGNMEEGIKAYKAAIEKDSTDTGAYVNLGIAYMNNNEGEPALKAFKTAHRMQPKDMGILEKLATAQHRLGDNEGALESAQKALKLDPENLDVLNMAGQLFLLAQNYDKAAEILEKVVAKQPENNTAVFNLAAVYKNQGKFDEAEALFEKSIEADPNDHEALYQLGLVYDRSENFDKAIASFERFVELKPTEVRGYRALSRAYARKSQKMGEGTEEAQECARKAEEAFNMAETLANQQSSSDQ